MINVPITLNILLRHVRSLIPFVIILPNTRQALVKELIHIWSTASDERSRVISFVCLFHLVREHRKEIMGVVLRVLIIQFSFQRKFSFDFPLENVFGLFEKLQIYIANDASVDKFHATVISRTLFPRSNGYLSTWFCFPSSIDCSPSNSNSKQKNRKIKFLRFEQTNFVF